MNSYKLLRTPELSKGLTEEFKREFEDALSKAVKDWENNGKLVDQFEDNYAEASFAKGFLAGCIYVSDKLIEG